MTTESETVICHFTIVHSALDGRIFKKECCSLARAGYKVYIVAPNSKEEIINNVTIVNVPLQSKGRFRRILFGSKAVFEKALSLDADIYHFHDPELLPHGLKLKKRGKKVIFDSHEDIPNDIRIKKYMPYIVRMILYACYKLYEFYAVKKFDAVISVTPHIVEKLKKLNPRTALITNYPIIPPEIMIGSQKIEKFKVPTIVYAGPVSPFWMHENIIRSLDSIDINIKYIIAGETSEEYIRKLQDLKSWNKVEYLGLIPYHKVVELYAQSHIGLALLNYNRNVGGNIGTLGNTKLFEIMMAGLPVICTDFVLWKQIVEDYEAGICINPNDVGSISNAIVDLISNKEKSERMGLNGKKITYEQYSWNTQESVLLDIYSKIVSQMNTLTAPGNQNMN